MIDIVTIDTPSLGDRGYLATDGTVAMVVDAQRDIDRILELADQLGVAITHVLETHIHNDYLTGGFALATATGAQYLVNAADPVSFNRTPITDGELITVGQMRVEALATPGHTFTHLAYVLSGAPVVASASGPDPVGASGIGTGAGDAPAGDAGRVLAVFTGGSLLNGATGRTDLLGAEHREALARAQFSSGRRLASQLPDDARVYPTHGFGSFCSAGPARRSSAGGGPSTIREEKSDNPALTETEADYVAELLASLDAYPAYYAHMGPANLAGPPAPDLSVPQRADSAELVRRIEAGEWVVDLRSRTAFAAGHLRGTLNFELGGSLATYLGWLIPWGSPVTLIGNTLADVAAAQRDLCRIGVDKIAAAATGSPSEWAAGEPLERFEVADFRALATALNQRPSTSLVVLDVRSRSEWDGGHVDGAVHIPLPELPARLAEVPPGEVWVYCQSGFRSAVAASLLAARGRTVCAINDEFAAAERAGIALAAADPSGPGMPGARSRLYPVPM
jgi:hydroxyacylglutathione hydrolase